MIPGESSPTILCFQKFSSPISTFIQISPQNCIPNANSVTSVPLYTLQQTTQGRKYLACFRIPVHNGWGRLGGTCRFTITEVCGHGQAHHDKPGNSDKTGTRASKITLSDLILPCRLHLLNVPQPPSAMIQKQAFKAGACERHFGFKLDQAVTKSQIGQNVYLALMVPNTLRKKRILLMPLCLWHFVLRVQADQGKDLLDIKIHHNIRRNENLYLNCQYGANS